MSWLRRRKIAFKLSLLVLSGVTLVIAGILTLNYNVTRQLMVEKIEDNAFNLAQATANRINTLLKAAEKIPAGVALTITELKPDDAQLKSLLKARLKQNSEIFGIAAAFAPKPFPAIKSSGPDKHKLKLYSRYYTRVYNQIKESPIEYDYRSHDWYQIPRVLSQAIWSEPYFGESGGTIMTSYSYPFYRKMAGHKEFAGIVCIDLSLNWLRNVVSSLKIGKTGYAFLITRNGTFVTHPDLDLIMNETIFSVAETRNNPYIREIGRRMIAGEKGFTAFTSLTNNKKYWMVYTPLPANSWSLGVLFPQKELMADIQSLNKLMLGLGIGGFFLIILVILLISRKITKPLSALAKSANQIASGDLETNIPVPQSANSNDEVDRLTLSFAEMQRSLKEYIKNLTETTAAKERIESELNIASEIQMGILPKIFPPPFPMRPEFDLYATMRPAREVGGDLYDFFMLDEQHLCFTVGDVSGKGVAAALFMAITQTLIKTHAKAQSRRSSSVTLERVNNDLARDNPSMMFVTLFLGILDITTGELEYCNGGHNPPYRLAPKQSKTVQALATTDGIALGVMEDLSFSNRRITLTPGEALFVFTDGVTEAMNNRDELFGETRLENILAPIVQHTTAKIADQVMNKIDNFSSGIPQTDDITMLVIRYNGNEKIEKG
ncbi:MAG: SpoIIE family protein phosphatase [Deltaproteobacteria bacterium]|nr:SpoIIE family protein phosphatase [Candidatus Tharpella sp.]